MSARAVSIARPVTQEHVQHLARIISKMKKADLTLECQNCGVPVSGNKSDQSARLAMAICAPSPITPYLLVSLDIGLYNFARAILRVDSHVERPTLVRWEKQDLALPTPFHPRQNALKLRDLAMSMVAEVSEEDRRLFLIERQSFRGGGLRMIPGVVLDINRIEVQLHCFLLEQEVISVNPQSVAKTFDLETKKEKKKHAVKIVDSLCSHPKDAPIKICPEIIDAYKSEVKRDDLADSLLQGLAYLKWRTNLEHLRRKMEDQSGIFMT